MFWVGVPPQSFHFGAEMAILYNLFTTVENCRLKSIPCFRQHSMNYKHSLIYPETCEVTIYGRNFGANLETKLLWTAWKHGHFFYYLIVYYQF